MSMFTDYLCHTASWKARIGHDGMEPTYADPADIPVRWIGRRRLVRNAQGEEVVSEAKVLTEAAVNPGDTLTYDGREWPVIAVSEKPDFDGNVSGRDVAC